MDSRVQPGTHWSLSVPGRWGCMCLGEAEVGVLGSFSHISEAVIPQRSCWGALGAGTDLKPWSDTVVSPGFGIHRAAPEPVCL